jgi:hypothetical protein
MTEKSTAKALQIALLTPLLCASGYSSGIIIEQFDGAPLLYLPGLLFGIAFTLGTGLFFRDFWRSSIAIVCSTAFYWMAVQIAAGGYNNAKMFFVAGLAGAGCTSILFFALFHIRIFFVIMAIFAGGALGVLLVHKDHYELCLPIALWHLGVGLLLALGLETNKNEITV